MRPPDCFDNDEQSFGHKCIFTIISYLSPIILSPGWGSTASCPAASPSVLQEVEVTADSVISIVVIPIYHHHIFRCMIYVNVIIMFQVSIISDADCEAQTSSSVTEKIIAISYFQNPIRFFTISHFYIVISQVTYTDQSTGQCVTTSSSYAGKQLNLKTFN